ncbi:MAG: YbaL family putative K(+) efflux transporter [Reyranella sp.]|uniref:YbaL family putative K(+) efflux transporter n=1 Tax=Reyranella sp. TaxID=1929291 RepID=UPI003D1466AF
MFHETSLVATIVVGLGLAFVLAAIANRIKVSLLVGYLLAGVAVGPFTPGFVADQKLAAQLAEIGVILLMFGVGLHFSTKDLLAMRRVVVPGALVQMSGSTLLGMAVAWLLGWPLASGFVFGLALSVASTVVLMRALQEHRLLDSERGHVAAGWLVVQDLLMVLALVLLPPLVELLKEMPSSSTQRLDLQHVATTTAVTLGKVAAFIALMLMVGRRVIPQLLHYIAHTGSRELFRLAVLSVALGVAFIAAELFSVSFALGAFFAGMILSESELSQRAAEESLPLRDAFAALFFLSVGMLFDPAVFVREPLPLLATLLVVLVGNTTLAFGIVRLLGYPRDTALTVGVGLAQIGEFSFILADLGIGLGVLTERARDLILGASMLSILLNPLMFAAKDRWKARLRPAGDVAPQKDTEVDLPVTSLEDHVVLVGYGRVGSIVGERLHADGVKLFVIDESAAIVERLRMRRFESVPGNAANEAVVRAANLARARLLIVAIPNAFEAGQVVQQAKRVNPALKIVARAHYDAEVEHLRGLGADQVIMGEREIAQAMLRTVLGVPEAPLTEARHGTQDQKDADR